MGSNDDDAEAAVIQPNGRLVIVGQTYENSFSSNVITAGRFLGGQGTIGFEEFEDGNFALYPNPAKEFIQLEFEENVKDVKLKLMDQQGRVVMKSIGSGYDVRMELSGLSKGLYVLQVTMDGDREVFRKAMVE